MSETKQLAEIRLSNLRALIGDQTVAEFSRKYAQDAAYIWQITNPDKTERKIGERFCRRLEEKMGLELHWMDKNHQTKDSAIVVSSFARIVAAEASRRDVPDDMQQTILYLLRNAPMHES